MAQQPIFVLHGRIVTMQAEDNIIDDGYLVVQDGRIAAIVDDLAQLPAVYAAAKIIETGGTIYPGLIDLHNHFVYNVLPLWIVPRQYNNRSQWPAHREYRSDVSKPIKQALARFSISSKSLVRYVEAKALISGTTTGQGMRTQVKGSSKIFEGAMRNVEEPGNEMMLAAGTMVPDLIVTGATAEQRKESFRRALNNEKRSAYFYHLSEGIDDIARRHFFNLKDNDLISEKLVGIHSLGLHLDDLKYLAQKGAKVVWSPFSNQLLYGKTLNLKDLKDSGVLFSLGCDWSPSGSKNMLQELKVAYHTNEVQDNVFTTFELVEAATSKAAAVTGWQDFVGTLEVNKLADILIISGNEGDPYLQLIQAVEKDVELVVVDGVPRYGNVSAMKYLLDWVDESMLEEITIANTKKGIYLFNEKSELNDIGFEQAISTLKDIMNDLPGFVKRMEEEEGALLAMGENIEQEFTIELDNEFEIEADVFAEYVQEEVVDLFADVPMADRVEFDSAIVEGAEYLHRIEAQLNISDDLKAWLKKCYY